MEEEILQILIKMQDTWFFISDKDKEMLVYYLRHVTDLDLDVMDITDRDLKHLAEGLVKALENPTNAKLTYLGLSSQYTTPDRLLEHLEKILKHPNCSINSIDLSESSISDKLLQLLIAGSKITSLNLSYVKIGDIVDEKQFMINLREALLNNSSLEFLFLSGNNITDEGLRELLPALIDPNCKITSLDLSANNITDEGLRELLPVLTDSNCKITSINLSNNKITNQGLRELLSVLTDSNCKITSINLSGNQITDGLTKELLQLLEDPNCKITNLNLNSCKIKNDEEAKKLFDVIRDNKTLKSLSINFANSISESEMVKIAALGLSRGIQLYGLGVQVSQAYNEILNTVGQCYPTTQTLDLLAQTRKSKSSEMRILPREMLQRIGGLVAKDPSLESALQTLSTQNPLCKSIIESINDLFPREGVGKPAAISIYEGYTTGRV